MFAWFRNFVGKLLVKQTVDKPCLTPGVGHDWVPAGYVEAPGKYGMWYRQRYRCTPLRGDRAGDASRI